MGKSSTSFKPGNQFWKARSSHGRNPKFETPEDLWDAAEQYFQWVEDNPLMSAELVKFQGEATIAKVPKMRAMTHDGLQIFIGISDVTWLEYCKKPDFASVTQDIKKIIRNQKFGGAAADLLNANIIARDLGLSDKTETKVTLSDDFEQWKKDNLNAQKDSFKPSDA